MRNIPSKLSPALLLRLPELKPALSKEEMLNQKSLFQFHHPGQGGQSFTEAASPATAPNRTFSEGFWIFVSQGLMIHPAKLVPFALKIQIFNKEHHSGRKKVKERQINQGKSHDFQLLL